MFNKLDLALHAMGTQNIHISADTHTYTCAYAYTYTHTHACMFLLSFVRDHVALRDGAARQRTRRRPMQLAHCQHVLQLLGTHRREIGHCDCCAGLNVFLLLRLLTIRMLHVLVVRPRASLMGGSFTTYGSLAASKMLFLGNTGLGLVLAGMLKKVFV